MTDRESIDLNGIWGFRPDPANSGIDDGWYGIDIDACAWHPVQTPIAFDDCGADMDRYTGAGWFRRTVFVPVEWLDRRIVLHCEGVSYNAAVWVNGRQAGESHDAFLPCEWPVGSMLRCGEENLVVVRIDNIRGKGQFPLFEGWFGQGGFLREAHLVATDFLHLAWVRITAEPREDGGSFTLTGEVANDGDTPGEGVLHVSVRDDYGCVLTVLTSETVRISPGAVHVVSVNGCIPNIMPWSPATPTLYLAQVELRRQDMPIDCSTVRFGFRRVETLDGKILFNGSPVFLMGFNRHEDSPRTGMAVDLVQARADFLEMQHLGANFVRLCHYPHHPGELDLCDELGLLVMTENAMNEWGHVDHPAPNPGFALTPDDAPMIIENGKRTLRKMVERDANHPSVILCSVGNESEETRPYIMEGNRQLIEFGRALDSTRLWTHVSNKHSAPGYTPAFYLADDVIVVNCYPTHHLTVDETTLAGGFSASTQMMREITARLHADYLEKPIVIGEFGYPTWHGEAVQMTATIAEFAGLDAPYVAGAALWLFAQHPWAADACYAGGQRLSPYGYMSRDRRIRYQAFEAIARMFRERAEGDATA